MTYHEAQARAYLDWRQADSRGFTFWADSKDLSDRDRLLILKAVSRMRDSVRRTRDRKQTATYA